MPEQKKFVRVRALRGFQGYADEGEEKPTHLPGAVFDLEENTARAEVHLGRVEVVDSSTPVAEGKQKETSGESADQIRERVEVETKAKEGALVERIARLEALLVDAKKGK